MIKNCYRIVNLVFDKTEDFWGSDFFRRIISIFLFITFAALSILTQMKISGLLTNPIFEIIPNSHFYAIRFAFTLLLGYEVLSMVFSLRYSVSNAIGKQIEILSLVILRDGFKDLVYFQEPLSMISNLHPISVLLSDMFGALAILVILGFFYKTQSHIPLTQNEEDQLSFISVKKCLALFILLFVVVNFMLNIFGFYNDSGYYSFFDSLFTFLIFTDILLVFLALRYSSNYYIIFRNYGFALTTVLIRIAITAPEYYRAILGIIAVSFALLLSWSYKKFRVNLKHWGN